MDETMSTDAPHTDHRRPPIRNGNRAAGFPQAALLLIGSCMPILGSVLLAPILPSMATEFPGPSSAVLVPLVLTAPALMMALLSPAAGFFADRIGRKRALIIAMFLYSICGVAPVAISSLPGIIATRVGVGIGEAFIMTICTTLIMDYFDGKRRAMFLGMQAMLATLAATVFMAAGGMLGGSDWRIPFWVYSVGLLLAVLMAFFLWEPAESAEEGVTVPVPWRVIAAPVAVSVFGGILFYTLVVHLPFVVTALGMADTRRVGFAAAIAALATAVGSIAFRWLLRMGVTFLLPVSFALAAIGLIAVGLSQSPGAAVLGAVVAGLGTGIMLPTLLTWSVAGLEFHVRGRGAGVWTAAFWSGQFLTPVVIAVIAGRVGGLQAGIGAVGVTAAVAAIGSALIFLIRSRRGAVRADGMRIGAAPESPEGR